MSDYTDLVRQLERNGEMIREIAERLDRIEAGLHPSIYRLPPPDATEAERQRKAEYVEPPMTEQECEKLCRILGFTASPADGEDYLRAALAESEKVERG